PGAFRSTDAGANWTAIGLSGETVTSLTFLDSGTLLAATTHGVFRSSDAGETWEDAGLASIEIDGVEPMHGEPEGVYAWAQFPQGILYRSTDAGDHWQQVHGPFERLYVQEIRSSRTDVGLAYLASMGGLFVSEDEGATWEARNGDLSSPGVTT